MKKLLILMLVLGLASSANAVIISFVSPSGPPCTHGNPPPAIDVLAGSVVLVQIVSDTVVTSSYQVSIMESTTSAAGHSTALAPGTYNAAFNLNVIPGNLRNALTNNPNNSRYILIDRATASANPPVAIQPGDPLYWFEVLIPEDAEFCDTFTIDAAVGMPVIAPPPAGYSHMVDGAVVAGSCALTIHVVPEPMTIALLGLGGLLLRRRK